MAVLIVMSAAIMLLVYFITRQSMAREVESRYESVILHANEKIRGVLSDVYVAAINNINVIESDLDNPDKLQIHLERMVSDNMYMSSCRLIFEPHVFPAKGQNFEIYAWRDSTGKVHSRQMNEDHPDFLIHDWYRAAFDNKEGDWTPPYFDRAASQQLTTTYMTHIRDHKGRRVGMLGADVSLQWLRERTKRIDTENHERFERDFKEKSYSFVIDHDGTFLIHPDENRVLKQKLQDMTVKTPSLKDDLMARQMMAGSSGTVRLEDEGIDLWVFYSFVKYADWTVAVVVPTSIIYHNGDVLASMILAVFFVGLLLIYFLCSHYIRKNMRPLKRFVMAADELAQGNFDIELPEVRSREIDALLSESVALFAGGDIPQEEKDRFFEALMTAYVKSKEAAKKTYGRKKD